MRQIRIDRNERREFECWEPNGCGPGKHALFDTKPTMKEAIDTILATHPGARLEFSTKKAALFTIPS